LHRNLEQVDDFLRRLLICAGLTKEHRRRPDLWLAKGFGDIGKGEFGCCLGSEHGGAVVRDVEGHGECARRMEVMVENSYLFYHGIKTRICFQGPFS
jgi:hypothetical protein